MKLHVCFASLRRTVCVASVILAAPLASYSQVSSGSQSARPLVVSGADDSRLTSIRSESFRLPAGANDLGEIDRDKQLDLRIVLARSPEQQSALELLTSRVHKPGDALYGKTLTPSEFAEAFAPNSSDIAAVSAWLTRDGFQVTGASGAEMAIDFHGTASQAEATFKTEIHQYSAAGREFFASSAKLQLPSALAPVIRGVQGLQNFQRVAISGYDGPVAGPSPVSSAATAHAGDNSVNSGWTSDSAGVTAIRNELRLHPDTGSATATAVTLTPSTVNFAGGAAVSASIAVSWTATGTPTGSVTVSDSNQTLSATVALTSCTAGAKQYTCTYNWTDAAGAGFTTPEVFTAVYSGDSSFATSTGTATLTVNYASGTLPIKRATALTVSPNTVAQGATTAQTINAVIRGSAAGGVPTGNIEVWGPGTIGLINEFSPISGTGAATGCSTGGVNGRLVTCTYSWNPPATLAAGSYQLEYSYSGTDTTFSPYQVVEGTNFTVTASGDTATTTTVSANPTSVGTATPGTTFTTITTWTGTAAAPTGTVQLTGPAGTFGGGPVGGAVFPATGSTTSSGNGTYDFGSYSYTYSCTTSTSNKTVTCTIVDSDLYDVLPKSGTNRITAAYGGDTTYAGSSGKVAITAIEYNTSTSVSASPASSVTGAAPTVTYTVQILDIDQNGTQPTGTVTLSGTTITGSPLTKNASACTYSTSTFIDTCTFSAVVPAATAAGAYTVTATYAGDATYAGSAGTLTFNVTGSTADSMTSSASPTAVSVSTPSTTVTSVLAWTGSGAAPTGTMTLSCDPSSAGTCTNLPTVNLSTCTTNTSAKTVSCAIPYALDSYDSDFGSYTLVTTYSGNATYTVASASTTVLDSVNAASTTSISLSPVSSYAGTAATTTATITIKGGQGHGHVTGTVTVTGTGTGTLGTLATITLPTATSSDCSVVTYTTVCTETLSIPAATAAGSYTITASYGGSATYQASSGSAGYTVLAPDSTTTTATATPGTIASNGTTALKAVVADTTNSATTPTGSVAFTLGSTTLGTCTLASGKCTISASGSSFAFGSNTVTATYTPSATTFAGSGGTTTVTVSVDATTTTASATPASIGYGSSTILKAVVADTTNTATTAAGSVTFTLGSTNLGTCSLGSGTCSVTAAGTSFAAGGNQVTATYVPSPADWSASSGTTTVTITTDATTTALTATPSTISYSGSTTLKATVTDSVNSSVLPTGTINFRYSGSIIGSCTLSAGTCSYSATGSTFAIGANTVRATYVPSPADWAGSTTTTTLTVTADTTSTTVTATPATLPSTGSTTLKATVGDSISSATVPPGSVTFKTGTTTLGSCTLTSGTCSITANGTSFANGGNTLTATYTPSSTSFGTSSGTTTVTIQADATATAVTATPSSIGTAGSTALKATVSDSTTPASTPAGTIAFTEGATSLGSCTLSAGTCSISVTGSTLGVGSDVVKATYSPSTTQFAGSFGTTTVSVASYSFSSVTHNFGAVVVGTTTSGTENYGVQLTNNSSAALGSQTQPLNTSISITGAGFTQTNNCGVSLAAGANCEIIFQFSPAATQSYSATWAVGQSGSFAPSNGGTLTGTGVTSGAVTMSTAKHNFGTQAVGTTSAVFGAVITNSTSSDATLTVGVPAGNTSSFITTLNNCGTTLLAGQSCNLQYEFNPQTTGALSEFVSVQANGANLTIQGSTAYSGLTLAGTGQ